MKRGAAGVLVAAFVVGCSPAADRFAPTPEARPSTPRGSVFVYQLRENGDGYRQGAYDAIPRRTRGPGSRLQLALAELVRGPTRAERRAGYTSAFSRETAGVLMRVELRGRRAVVDFEDIRREHGEWSTSYGGSVFLIQLTRTIFQFRRVRSILFRIDGSCERFWTFMQAGGCEVVHRRGQGAGVRRPITPSSRGL